MGKKIEFSESNAKKMIEGINSLANHVKVTLGYNGRMTLLMKSFGAPTITKDATFFENIDNQIFTRTTKRNRI